MQNNPQQNQYIELDVLADVFLSDTVKREEKHGRYSPDIASIFAFINHGEHYKEAMEIMLYRTKRDFVRYLGEEVLRASDNTDNKEAREFLDNVKMILGARLCQHGVGVGDYFAPADAQKMLKKLLDNINSIKNEQIQYNSLSFFKNGGDWVTPSLLHEALRHIVANPYATAQDMRMYIESEKESKSEHLVQIAELEAQIAELKGKLKETQEGWRETTEKLKESQIEIQKLNAENETAKEELRDAQIEIQKQRAINEGANAKLSKEKERTQRLIDATDQLQIGIGSRGIKKMRETVEQIEQEKRKIER